MVRLVKHGLKDYGFESISNNDKILSESQLNHEMVDRFVVVVGCKKVVRRFEDGYVDGMELELWFEQDIDVEEGRFEGDEDGGEV
ncbi:hypothetical protein Tco_1472414 [Tanacetum coccineum]